MKHEPDASRTTSKTINQDGVEIPPPTPRRKHEWGPSRVGHGEAQCVHCLMTNREAWVLGEYCING